MSIQSTSLTGSQKALLVQRALSSTLFAIGTGNFLAGYLTYLGASPAFCAIVAAIPQLGCIMQLISPFLFERLRHRKAVICGCCFAFRLGMGFAGVIPFLLPNKQAKLLAVFFLYLLAFLLAGFATPGLDQWTMELAPKHRRGRFFAASNIVSALLNSAISLALGWQLDYFTAKGRISVGYYILYSCCCLFACVDLLLMHSMEEIPSNPIGHLRLKDLAKPLQDRTYRKIVILLLLWFFAFNFSNTFLSVYMLQGLRMSHTAITCIATVASIAGILGTWFWGRLADRSSWNCILMWTGCIMGGTFLCWAVVRQGCSMIVPLIFQSSVAACNGSFHVASMNLQFSCCARKGKTLYLGVGAAISNLTGYFATLLGAAVQSMLMRQIGIRSINVLFGCSGLFCMMAVLLIVPRLKKVIPGEE